MSGGHKPHWQRNELANHTEATNIAIVDDGTRGFPPSCLPSRPSGLYNQNKEHVGSESLSRGYHYVKNMARRLGGVGVKSDGERSAVQVRDILFDKSVCLEYPTAKLTS